MKVFMTFFSALICHNHVISDSDELFTIVLIGFGDRCGYLGAIISLNEVTVNFSKIFIIQIQ